MSNWIPKRRIRIALAIAAGLAIVALAGTIVSPFALVLLLPAAGAGWAARVMVNVRRCLSDGGGGVERRIHDLVVAELALAATAEVALLDIGCGAGDLIVRVLERSPGVRATGVDLWGPGWDYARSSCERKLTDAGFQAEFEQMDAARLRYPDATFDAVVSVMCFHEVRRAGAPRSEGPRAAVREVLRVLRPGGRFVLVDRFADDTEFGPRALIDTVLRDAVDVRRVPLTHVLDLPGALASPRALGPVEVITGTGRP